MIEQAIGATPGTEYFTVNSIAYRMALVAGGTFDAAVALSPWFPLAPDGSIAVAARTWTTPP